MTDLQKGRPDHTAIAIQNGGSKEDSESRKHLVVLGISLDSLPRATQFLVCCGGVFLFYLIYGYVQVRNRCKIINIEASENHHWSADLTVWFVFLQTSTPLSLGNLFKSLSFGKSGISPTSLGRSFGAAAFGTNYPGFPGSLQVFHQISWKYLPWPLSNVFSLISLFSRYQKGK